MHEKMKMNSKIMIKLCIDIGMTIILLFLMTYELIGQAVHEWFGIGMFVLFLTHHILNSRWSRNILKGRYTPLRIWQTVLVLLVLACMAGSMISGVILSRHVLAFLPVSGGRSFGRNLHMLSAYWGFVFMSLHLGFHWNMMMSIAGNAAGKSSARTIVLRILALAAACYGLYAFVKREIGSYLFLKSQFVFFDFEEPLLFFLLDYMAVMELFVWIGHYTAKLLKQRKVS